MKPPAILRRALDGVRIPGWLVALCLVGCALAVAYPRDLDPYVATLGSGGDAPIVQTTEHRLRFINVALPIGLVVLKRDAVGLVQLAYVTVAGTIATHGTKRLVNDISIRGTRLGERPYSPDSKHNMPSGHSSLASSGAWFVCRRYGWRWALLVVPVMLLTMYAGVMLDAHTCSAVIAGALIGIVCAALFTSRRRCGPSPQPAAGG